jgi:tRNA-2-methylthio-N6-dimethylallyladenosine synthase
MVLYLRKKDPLFSISTDIIVGFSWETEEMFNQTLNAVKECEIDFVYNARYSVRKWTLASKLYTDNISNSIKAERWHKINNLLKKNVLKRNKLMLWNIEQVMVSWKKDWNYFWRTRNYKEIHFTSENYIEIWDIIEVKLEKAEGFIIKWIEI